jgi:hypothetical protein
LEYDCGDEPEDSES